MEPYANPKAAKYVLVIYTKTHSAQRTLLKSLLKKALTVLITLHSPFSLILSSTVNYTHKIDIEDIALTIKSNTEYSGRTDANLIDALHGLSQYDVTIETIESYMAKKKGSTFHECTSFKLIFSVRKSIIRSNARRDHDRPTTIS